MDKIKIILCFLALYGSALISIGTAKKSLNMNSGLYSDMSGGQMYTNDAGYFIPSAFGYTYPYGYRIHDVQPSNVCAYCRSINHVSCMNQHCIAPPPVPPMFQPFALGDSAMCAYCKSINHIPCIIRFCLAHTSSSSTES
uniref:Uncharacterized protein n=1 Tax=Pinctada fucata TaxID=50426 RepID=A0A194AME5_PINFU